MSRHIRTVIHQISKNRVLCDDGTIWWLKEPEGVPSNDLEEKEWVQVAPALPGAERSVEEGRVVGLVAGRGGKSSRMTPSRRQG